jgi:hypothetical protein
MVVCVRACKAPGYAREGLPLCDGDRNAVARAPPGQETNGGAWPEARAVLEGEDGGKAEVRVKAKLMVSREMLWRSEERVGLVWSHSRYSKRARRRSHMDMDGLQDS